MVATCSAYNCSNRFKKGSDISFYHFPKDPDLRKKWIIATKRKDFVPSKWSKLCSEHFSTDAFQIRPNAFFKLLNPGAIPTIFEFPEHRKPKPTKKRRTIVKAQVPSIPQVADIDSAVQSSLNTLQTDYPAGKKRMDAGNLNKDGESEEKTEWMGNSAEISQQRGSEGRIS
ncbi:THAP domain-containing protein 1 B-like [Nilaparvata lugens]|uniref:THAP domain-containing protein 1 B-like n=1 Tax=Nilaparvata lugens TaxID=108931 RepID=UPI00193E0EA2|nr:THAP domain-containing protein 1 B-like [Nilaparvata lugens]